MATPTIREAVAAAAIGGAATVNTGAGTAVDDDLVCFAGNDFNQAANLGPPTGTAGTWAFQVAGDNGTNSCHLKIYTRAVTAGGAQTVTVSPTPDNEEVTNSVIVLVGADIASPADGTPTGGNGASSSSHIAPATSPGTTDALLLCGAQTDGTAGSGTAYAPPSGMTEQTDVKDGTFTGQSVASLVLSSSGSTGTKTFTLSPNSTPYATASIAIKGASAAAGIPFAPGRAPQYRDSGEAPWLQKDRRNAHLVGTAANPLTPPLDSAWQADARYWHLYNDVAQRFTFAPYAQKDRRDANTVGSPPPAAVLSAAQRAVPVRDYGEAQWLQGPRRDPALLLTALLENELLGGADGSRHTYVPATHTDRREVPQQRVYFDPALLATAQLEDPILFSGEVDKRTNLPASHADRRIYPQQPARLADQSSAPANTLDPLLANAAGRWLTQNTAALTVDRRQVPQQRAALAGPDDVQIVGTGALGAWWGADDLTVYIGAQRRATDLSVAAPPALFDPVLGGWLPSWLAENRAATHTDRREVPQQRDYRSDPSFYPTIPPTDPLTLAWGAGGGYWTLYNTAALAVSRRLVPQQRERESDPNLLLSALLENELLGGADDLRRHYQAAYYDRRLVPQQRLGYAAADVAADPLQLVDSLRRAALTPAYYDRRQVPQQPARRTLYFDAGPGQPPLTLAWGAGGGYWHLYNRPSRPRPFWPLYAARPALPGSQAVRFARLGGAWLPFNRRVRYGGAWIPA